MVDIIDENFSLHASKIPGLTEGMKVYKSPGINYVDSGLSCDTFNVIQITMNIYKILKRPFFGNFMVVWRSPLSPEQKMEWQPISVNSKSGGVIKGLFAKSKTNQQKATIVLGHPMGKEGEGIFY